MCLAGVAREARPGAGRVLSRTRISNDGADTKFCQTQKSDLIKGLMSIHVVHPDGTTENIVTSSDAEIKAHLLRILGTISPYHAHCVPFAEQKSIEGTWAHWAQGEGFNYAAIAKMNELGRNVVYVVQL